jgi:hypothetical protein
VVFEDGPVRVKVLTPHAKEPLAEQTHLKNIWLLMPTVVRTLLIVNCSMMKNVNGQNIETFGLDLD